MKLPLHTESGFGGRFVIFDADGAHVATASLDAGAFIVAACNALAAPSSDATRYGPRAESIEHTLRAAGFLVAFDMPGEGFTLCTPDGGPVEPVPEAFRAIVDELEQLSTYQTPPPHWS